MKKAKFVKLITEEQKVNPRFDLVFKVVDDDTKSYVVSDQDFSVDSYGDGTTKVYLEDKSPKTSLFAGQYWLLVVIGLLSLALGFVIGYYV